MSESPLPRQPLGGSRDAGVVALLAVLIAAAGVLRLGWIVAQYARPIHAAGSFLPTAVVPGPAPCSTPPTT
ncbi:hypothetical protein [Blastococcus sp. SYSU D00820]